MDVIDVESKWKANQKASGDTEKKLVNGKDNVGYLVCKAGEYIECVANVKCG